jgi:hypothetical protein
MNSQPLEQVVRSVDSRLTKVEQILPTLAPKMELREAIAPLATSAEMHDAIREEGARTRQYFDVVAERLEGHIRLLAEGQVSLREQMGTSHAELKSDIAKLDRRLMHGEVRRP